MRFASKAALAAIAAIACLWASPGAQAQNVANGRSLFLNFCQSCHGNPPQGGPERAGNDPALIRTAISSKVPDMRTLSFLTNSDLADIAAWIASLSAPAGPPTPAADYTDLWYNAAESGWGFNIIQHAQTNNIFGVLYTYDANRRPVWFVLPGGNWTTSTLFIGVWYRVTGPGFNGPFDSTNVHVTQVGNVQISFTDANHGTLSYSVNGTQVVKTIERQPF